MATIAETFTIAVEHHHNGRFQTAERIYRQILEVVPQHPDALHLLGVLKGQAGNYASAVEYIVRAIAINSKVADYHINLAESYRALHRFSEAVECCRRAVELSPDDAVAYDNLGKVFKDQGQMAEAIRYFRRAVQLSPDMAELHVNLGDALRDDGRPRDAIACYQRAIELEPNHVVAHGNLGTILLNHGFHDEAVVHNRRVVELKPTLAAGYSNLASALGRRGQLTEAISCCRRALALDPKLAVAHNNLGNALKDQGQVVEAIACFRESLQLDPDAVPPRNNLLYALHYRYGVTLAELAEEHREFEHRHGAPLRETWRPHLNDRNPNRRLRLGFVSPDLHYHPVGFFLIRVLENLDNNQCEIVCYNDYTASDKMTERIRATASLWRDVAWQDNQKLAKQIHEDRIDVLFDLSGHMANNRLLVFARKPAPIQITWIGYVGTTGLKAMDYLLADRYLVPESEELYFQERILRMPNGFLCYDPPDYAPWVSPLPAFERGFVTFGCFNNPAKVSPQVIELWAKILQRTPASRLVLKFTGFNDPWVSRYVNEQFCANGIDVSRIELLDSTLHSEALRVYHRIDLALDPYHYNGGTTTCDALWMGVPVMTCPGETFASRMGLTHLTNVGLAELIATDLDDYVERTVALASDLPRLAALRATLRERMAASPLCDGRRFAEDLMLLLRDAWKQWVETSPPPPRTER